MHTVKGATACSRKRLAKKQEGQEAGGVCMHFHVESYTT